MSPVNNKTRFHVRSFFLALIGLSVSLSSAAVYAATIAVPKDFATIQSAVNFASPGDTILVSPGTYSEQVVIGKDLTLTGLGGNPPIIEAPVTLTLGAFGKTSLVEINNGATVTMSRFIVTGPGHSTCASGNLGAGFRVREGATLHLSFAAITHIHDTPMAACSGDGVVVGSRASSGHATIDHVEISDYQANGIILRHPDSTATITHNVITGVGASTVALTLGINIIEQGVAVVTDNTISQNLCDVPGCGPDPINQGQAAGIVANGGPGTVISHNKVSDNDIGIYPVFAPGCCAIDHNTLTDNRYFGLVIQDGSNAASHDRITGGRVGVAVVADAVDTTGTLEHEHIDDTSGQPIQTIQCCGFTATAIVK